MNKAESTQQYPPSTYDKLIISITPKGDTLNNILAILKEYSFSLDKSKYLIGLIKDGNFKFIKYTNGRIILKKNDILNLRNVRIKRGEVVRKKQSSISLSLRFEILSRDNFTCQDCWIKGKSLDVHHIIPFLESFDNSLENLITLCRKCHMTREQKLRKGIEKVKIENKIELITRR